MIAVSFPFIRIVLTAQTLVAQVAAQPSAAAGVATARAVTIADCIEMTKLGDPQYYNGASSNGLVAHYAPDATRFVVVLRRGDLHDNTNEYSLLMWRTADLFTRSRPEVVLTMKSSSNRPAIEQITWSADGRSIFFLGEHPGESHQLYRFRLSPRSLTKLTSGRTNLINYSMAANAPAYVYTTEPPPRSLFSDATRREGLVISTQPLARLMGQATADPDTPHRLFVKRPDGTVRQLKTLGGMFDWFQPSISPDGSYVLVAARVAAVPAEWHDYTDPWVRRKAQVRLRPGEFSEIQQYELINARTGESRVLMDAPSGKWWSESAWRPNGKSVVLTNVFLSLHGVSDEERRQRESHTVTVEVGVPDGEITEVTSRDLILHDWDARTDELVFDGDRDDYRTDARAPLRFRKVATRWEAVSGEEQTTQRPTIVLKEDLHTPPKIFAVYLQTRRESMLLDLNPQFSGLAFGRVEEITWKDSSGREMKGGLYFPANYSPGKRYPLVIQTHAWQPNKFWIDGPWTTAFAAQSFAGNGIMVLQLGYSSPDALYTAEEAAIEASTFDSGIAYLDGRGLIDTSRIGLVGFSRTCLHVKYALIHSRYRIAAASVTDGVDAGYLQYVLTLNFISAEAEFFEKLNGGVPWGTGLRHWADVSPGFNLDKVQTPIRIVALNAASASGEWEWFAGLQRLAKPVDMVMIQDGSHILERPWDRVVSQQGNVDWFLFWLEGKEDADPAKQPQYARWRAMRPA